MKDSNLHPNRKGQGNNRSQRPDPSVTEGADSRYNPHTGNNQRLIIYQREIVLRTDKRQSSRGSTPKRSKSDIQRFSRKSRLRMLRKMNRLQTAALTSPLFITLTARNSGLDAELFRFNFLKIFLPKLKEIIPGLVYMWRLEFHESGYPHIHMFAWSFEKHRNLHSQFYKRPIREAWRKSIEDDSRAAQLYSCKIKELNNFKSAMHYTAKYTAKEETDITPELTGRRWAVSKNFPASPISEIPLRRDQAKMIIELAKAVQRKREERGARPFEITGDETEIFIWLEPSVIYNYLKALNRHGEANIYERVLTRGSPDRTEEELELLAKEYGYDY